MCDDVPELAYVRLVRREVRAVKYTVVLRCVDRGSGAAFESTFTGGNAFPAGRRVGGSLVASAAYEEQDKLREAQVRVTLDFRGSRARMRVRVVANGSESRCRADWTMRLRHGGR